MKLYEKTGDHKVTGLKDGTRVSKQDVRIHLMGELDELNSHIGLVRSLTQNKALWQELLEIQKILLAIKHGVEEPEGSRVKSVASAQVKDLEIKIGGLEKQLPQTEGEILPGGCFYSAQFDIARNVARRCERRFAEVAACYPMDELATAYLNRVSDYLYIQARLADMAQQGLSLEQQIALQVENRSVEEPVIIPAAAAVSEPVPKAVVPTVAEKIPVLCKDRVTNRVKKFSTKYNNSYGTFYTVCVLNADGELLATNSLARHSVQVHGSMAAAKEALHRCKVQGEKAAGVMKNGAALYENGYLVGAVGIYGGNEKMNNEKAQLAMEMLKGAVQR